jgi:hypothetical protein
MTVATSRILEDAEGPYVLLPDGWGFGEGTAVEISRVGDVITVRRTSPAANEPHSAQPGE